MVRVLSISPLMRAILIIGVVAAFVTSITYAALQSQATLTGNTIASATADLEVSSDGGTTFSDSEDGFDFAGVVPGGADSQIENFDLRNNGDVDLGISAEIPTLPTWVDELAASVAVDNSKVNLTIDCTSTGGSFNLTGSLADYNAAGGVAATGDALEAGVTPPNDAACTAVVDMDSDAVTGTAERVESNGFDVVFTGVAV